MDEDKDPRSKNWMSAEIDRLTELEGTLRAEIASNHRTMEWGAVIVILVGGYLISKSC